MRKFRRIYIEITNVCNLKCNFCPVTNRKPEFMTTELFKRILYEIREYTEYIYLHVKGEPFLHPEIDKILDISFEKGFKVNITTNGTLINNVRDKIINKKALRQINFSLHSFDGNDDSENKTKYINDIIEFTKDALKHTNIITALRLWNLDKDNKINKEKAKNREILRIIEKEFDLKDNIEEKLTSEKGIKIAERLYLNYEHEFQWPSLDIKEERTAGYCYGLRTQAGILVDGTVVPCCLDNDGIINLGNLKVQSFNDIIYSERAKNIYDGFTRHEAVEELCRKCGYKDRFEK